MRLRPLHVGEHMLLVRLWLTERVLYTFWHWKQARPACLCLCGRDFVSTPQYSFHYTSLHSYDLDVSLCKHSQSQAKGTIQGHVTFTYQAHLHNEARAHDGHFRGYMAGCNYRAIVESTARLQLMLTLRQKP